jgi:hypothetical protein
LATNTASTVTVNSLTFTTGTQTLTLNPVQNLVNSSGGILVAPSQASMPRSPEACCLLFNGDFAADDLDFQQSILFDDLHVDDR